MGSWQAARQDDFRGFAIFQWQKALPVMVDQTDILPAVGGAPEDELHPDADEIADQPAAA